MVVPSPVQETDGNIKRRRMKRVRERKCTSCASRWFALPTFACRNAIVDNLHYRCSVRSVGRVTQSQLDDDDCMLTCTLATVVASSIGCMFGGCLIGRRLVGNCRCDHYAGAHVSVGSAVYRLIAYVVR